MKLLLPSSRRVPRFAPAAAFTMVEIALALAVIGFALVSIIGVLPTGLDVQKNNRRETIINQDAQYFIEAIRGGARGIDDLTNYVIAITNFWARYDANGNVTGTNFDGYDYGNFSVTSAAVVTNDYRLTNGLRIIGILSTPKYRPLANGFFSNYVVAYVRAISGAAMEKYPQTNEIIRDAAFTYRLVAEVMPFSSRGYFNGIPNDQGFFHPTWTNFAGVDVISNNVPGSVVARVNYWASQLATNRQANPDPVYYLTNAGGSVAVASINLPEFRARAGQWLRLRQEMNNLSDVRLLFRWPVLPGNRLGNGRQAYRVMVGGVITNDPAGGPAHYIRPHIFARP